MKKSTSAPNALSLPVEEKMLLHGIIANGKEQYSETIDILSERAFEVFENKLLLFSLRGKTLQIQRYLP